VHWLILLICYSTRDSASILVRHTAQCPRPRPLEAFPSAAWAPPSGFVSWTYISRHMAFFRALQVLPVYEISDRLVHGEPSKWQKGDFRNVKFGKCRKWKMLKSYQTFKNSRGFNMHATIMCHTAFFRPFNHLQNKLWHDQSGHRKLCLICFTIKTATIFRDIFFTKMLITREPFILGTWLLNENVFRIEFWHI